MKKTPPHILHVMEEKDFPQYAKTASPRRKAWAAAHAFTARPGQCLVFPDGDGGIGDAILGGSGDALKDGARAAASLPPLAWAPQGDCGEAFGLGFHMAQYRFERFRVKKNTDAKPRLVVADKKTANRIAAINNGITLTRDLINLPANHLNPAGLEAEARKLARQHKAKISVIKGAALAKNFPAIEVVGRSAESPPRLIDMRWGSKGRKITIIGKGVTFDTGGLDIKPAGAMEIMKKDMGGAGIALGLAASIMGLRLPIRLRLLVPVAENAISAKAFRPLDVIKTAARIPVEIGNTDAEGRLLLADALYHATAKKESPDAVIDFATLTGAARVALGLELPALFCNDDALAESFLKAGEAAGDPLWRMPLHEPYARHIENGHTALSSTGGTTYGGAIAAALFLQKFLQTPATPWAHIDVMAWNPASRPGHPKGGEAQSLRATLRLIESKFCP